MDWRGNVKRFLAVGLILSGVPMLSFAKDPIIFVHGYSGKSGNFDTMVSRFKSAGWTSSELVVWSYDWRQSNATTASLVRDKVNQALANTGRTKVDIIAHSMGSLSSRYYLKNIDNNRTDSWVSLGGPNHGTSWAYACYDTSCYQMRPGSTFLNSLNSGDETPGVPRYATMWSSCDEIINPDESVKLSGATNHWVGCVGHLSLLSDSGTFTKTRDWVNKYNY